MNLEDMDLIVSNLYKQQKMQMKLVLIWLITERVMVFYWLLSCLPDRVIRKRWVWWKYWKPDWNSIRVFHQKWEKYFHRTNLCWYEFPASDWTENGTGWVLGRVTEKLEPDIINVSTGNTVSGQNLKLEECGRLLFWYCSVFYLQQSPLVYIGIDQINTILLNKVKPIWWRWAVLY